MSKLFFVFRCFFTTVSVNTELSNTSASQCITTDVSVGLAKLIECLVDEKNKEPVKHILTQVSALLSTQLF